MNPHEDDSELVSEMTEASIEEIKSMLIDLSWTKGGEDTWQTNILYSKKIMNMTLEAA